MHTTTSLMKETFSPILKEGGQDPPYITKEQPSEQKEDELGRRKESPKTFPVFDTTIISSFTASNNA